MRFQMSVQPIPAAEVEVSHRSNWVDDLRVDCQLRTVFLIDSRTGNFLFLLQVLTRNNARYGVAGVCNGGGGASALVLERL